MRADDRIRDLNHLWRTQPTEEPTMALDDIRKRFNRFETRIVRRNLREYVAAVLVIVVVAVFAWRSNESNVVILIGAGLLALGAIFVAQHLFRRGSVRPTPADLALQDCLAFHRSELVRQRDLLQSVLWWYLLPLTPGPALIAIGRAIERPDRRAFSIAYGIGFVILLVVVNGLNQRGARQIQRWIDDLDKERS